VYFGDQSLRPLGRFAGRAASMRLPWMKRCILK
jgi:hypothetical protein